MGLTAAQQRTLSRKAANNSLEVEHLLKLAEVGDASDASFLRNLMEENGWSQTGSEGRELVVPFGRWADTICIFLEDGYPGLVQAAKDSPDAADFCLGVFDKLKTSASVSAILAIGGTVIERPESNVKLAVRLADGFNLLLSFKGAPDIAPAVVCKVREFLHRLLAAELLEVQRARVVCALRGVGDADSVAVIASLPSFKGSWAGLDQCSVRQIERRLRRAEGGRG